MLAQSEPGEPPGRAVQHSGQVQLALVSGDLGQVPAPTLIGCLGAEVPPQHVRDRRSRLVRAGQRASLALRAAAHQALAGHRSRHHVDRHPPAGPRPGPPTPGPNRSCPGCRWGPRRTPSPPHPDRLGVADELPTRQGVGNTVHGPLGRDKRRHAHRVDSPAHRTTDRSRTSRSIRSSAFSRSSSWSRARASTVSRSSSPRSMRSLATQFPSVPSWIPDPGRPARSACPSPARSGPRPHGTRVVPPSLSLASPLLIRDASTARGDAHGVGRRGWRWCGR